MNRLLAALAIILMTSCAANAGERWLLVVYVGTSGANAAKPDNFISSERTFDEKGKCAADAWRLGQLAKRGAHAGLPKETTVNYGCIRIE